ncbi:fimbria/pilus periplasmic chaperone [Pseudomonas sp. Au-Pse12]|uniref:fimbria/pilus periplasmic chaperone n=1 Tax=Pseudomonas sp. Au-Pse12 TaxID=2906459 RepID=UPI001E3ADB17|nr:fimbria/pilus periplasmic chaperone [Pseudomonas sp. Au-Pse12]MCE4053233.1 fimbria/pilus periplasmic chaperone [Pseudomonas sp. Au-Pse12]
MGSTPIRAGAAALRACRCLLPGLLALCSGWAHADLSILGTRFIYGADKPAMSIRVGNSGRAPILLQAWLDQGDAEADPSVLAVPFVLSPPISRLEPRQHTALVLRYSGEPLPSDRESVFWINFLEVPPLGALKDNQLRLASRMRMKLLYRPGGLPGKADEAVGQLRWKLVPGGPAGATLLARNPTPYYVSFAELALGGARTITVQGITVEPLGSTRIALPEVQGLTPDQAVVHYQVATDSGETLSGSARIQD